MPAGVLHAQGRTPVEPAAACHPPAPPGDVDSRLRRPAQRSCSDRQEPSAGRGRAPFAMLVARGMAWLEGPLGAL